MSESTATRPTPTAAEIIRDHELTLARVRAVAVTCVALLGGLAVLVAVTCVAIAVAP